ncbi:MAG: hypothetical protein WC479_00535 [Candidatus Izemoplasmatales bacterium]
MASGNTAKDGSGIYYALLVNSAGQQIVVPAGVIEQQSDVTEDDSDKTFTVPAGFTWEILSIRVDYTSSADAGNRQLCIELTDGTNVIQRIMAGIVQAASLTRNYNFAVGLPDMTAFRDTSHLANPIPNGLILLPGYTVRIYDKAVIAAAADDMLVRMMVRKVAST